MKVWVVTGPIGAGKSSLSTLFANGGAAVVDADLLGHQVLESPIVMEKLAHEFGAECIRNGQVDRQFLGALVFKDKQAMTLLNSITHPPLVELAEFRLEELAKEGHHELAVLEAAVYFLWPPLKMVDMVISVVAEEDVKVHRLMESRGLTSDQVRDRIKSQTDLDRFWGTADVIIDNSSTPAALKEAVDDLLRINNL